VWGENDYKALIILIRLVGMPEWKTRFHTRKSCRVERARVEALIVS